MVILALGMSFCLSCWISLAIANDPAKADDQSAFGMMLGESKVALTGYFYEQADTFFHGGWEHQTKEAFLDGFYQKLAGNISPRYHIHLSGSEVKEIMPWLRLATITDPHDVRIFLDAAFWLTHEAARPDLAEKVLLNAQIENPFNYQIQLERGRLFLMEKKIKDARNAFNAGLAFWPGKEKTDNYETLDGKARLLLYRALLHEADGNKNEAISCLKQILALFPDRANIQKRIQEIEEGKEPSLLASRVLGDMLKHDTDRQSGDQCKHPGEE